MARKDPRIDAYIRRAAPFAQPILEHLRQLIHKSCPDVEETVKWGFPHFERQGVLCSMAAFKEHCAFGFWRWAEIEGIPGARGPMSQFGRISKRSDLPSDRALAAMVKKAVALNAAGKKKRAPVRRAKAPLVVPAELLAALKKNKKAKTAFDAMSASHQREYAEWIAEAKRDETRERRIEQAIAWLAQGKSRNWKYER
jgi:hypothetical protein